MTWDTLSGLKSLLGFPFRGADWANRFIIGCALLVAGWIVPIVPVLFVYGYGVAVMRRVIRGEEPDLPPWQDWGRLLMDGLRAFAVGLVYLLPGTLVYFGSIGFYFASLFGPPLLGWNEQQMGGVLMVAMLLLFVGLFLGSLLYSLGGIPLPAAVAHFVAEDRLEAAFQIRRWWAALKKRRWEYLIAWVLLWGIVGIIWFVQALLYYSVCLCWLIPIAMVPAIFYTMLIAAALFGQVWREHEFQHTG